MEHDPASDSGEVQEPPVDADTLTPKALYERIETRLRDGYWYCLSEQFPDPDRHLHLALGVEATSLPRAINKVRGYPTVKRTTFGQLEGHTKLRWVAYSKDGQELSQQPDAIYAAVMTPGLYAAGTSSHGDVELPPDEPPSRRSLKRASEEPLPPTQRKRPSGNYKATPYMAKRAPLRLERLAQTATHIKEVHLPKNKQVVPIDVALTLVAIADHMGVLDLLRTELESRHCYTRAELVEHVLDLNLSWNDTKKNISFLRRKHGAGNVPQFKEVKDYYEERVALRNPPVHKPSAADAAVLGKSARWIQAKDLVQRQLESPQLQRYLNFRLMAGEIHVKVTVDYLNINHVSGLEVGTLSLLNLRELRHSPEALIPAYLGSHEETLLTAGKTVRRSLLSGFDTNPQGDSVIDWRCPTREDPQSPCAYCEYLQSERAGEAADLTAEVASDGRHRAKVVKWFLADHAAVLYSLGLAKNCCHLCVLNLAKARDPSSLGEPRQKRQLQEAKLLFDQAAAEYFGDRFGDDGEAIGEKEWDAFRKSAAYSSWRANVQDETIVWGCECLVELGDDLRYVPPCTLHLLLSFVSIRCRRKGRHRLRPRIGTTYVRAPGPARSIDQRAIIPIEMRYRSQTCAAC